VQQHPDRSDDLKEIAVIGAGAAGTMAAIFAASGGARTVLLECTPDGGRKILISGGGRCNVLPSRLDESRFVTDSSPHTLRKIIRSWPLAKQIEFFERDLGVPLIEEIESAKMFPVSNRARDVRDGLLRIAQARGTAIKTGVRVTGVEPFEGRWRVDIKGAPSLRADAVILATGGYSVPNTGSDGAGLGMLRRLGHAVHPTYAALTPLRADPAPFGALAGVSLTVTLTARSSTRSAVAKGGFLFTHHGYSGPAVLDVSHVPVRSLDEHGPPARLTVQWFDLDEEGWEAVLRPDGTQTVARVLKDRLPERLATVLLERVGIETGRRLAHLRREERVRLVESLVRGEIPWTGHEGYKKAEVTGGGVSLSEIDPRTMESRKCAGLYICGEALDAFGPIGGYNFLWAWATGRAAGQGASAGFRG
jgi:predicted Rossmann fold flavoprotein